MGMFDSISVAAQLPYSEEMKELGLDTNKHVFQTKDLDCLLNEYIIQGDSLYITKYKTETWVEGDTNSKSVLGRIGHLKKGEPYLELVDFHGKINFYDYVDDVQGKWDCWIEYVATFTNNKLTEIKLAKFEKTDNAERKERDRNWQEECRRKNSLWYNKYFFHTKPVFWIKRILYRSLNRLGNFFTQLSYKF